MAKVSLLPRGVSEKRKRDCNRGENEDEINLPNSKIAKVKSKGYIHSSKLTGLTPGE